MVLSHVSAAAIHGLPMLGRWPDSAHVTVGRVSGGRSRNAVIKHALDLPDEDVVEVDGFLVTSIERTVIDLAVTTTTLNAVTAMDRALLEDRSGRVPSLANREAVWATYARRGSFRGHQRARRIIEFASTRSESPLESVSRVNMRVIGCPAPDLQVPFDDYRGRIGFVDFFWPRLGVVGEADGDVKYLSAAMRNGRDAAQVVLDEKRREDRIRAIVAGVTRWPWGIAMDPAALRAHLRAAGIPTS